MLNTLKDILDLCKNRIDEIDVDTQIDDIVKNGINHAYMFKISTVDKKFTTVKITSAGGIVTLPTDLIRIEKISPALVRPTEYRKGNTLFVNYDDVEYTITYEATRSPLTDDNSIVSASDRVKYLLSSYGCYAYQLYKKKTEMATNYLTEFNSGIAQLEMEIMSDTDLKEEEVIRDYYTETFETAWNGGM